MYRTVIGQISQRPRCDLAVVVAIFVSGVLGVCDGAQAARLLRFEICLDDQRIMEAIGGDSGRDDSAEVWSRLDMVKWHSCDGFDAPALIDDPLRALLSGRIVVRAMHASQSVLAEASVPELVLVRDTPESTEWRLPPEEVTRTGIAAGVVGSADRGLVGIRPGRLSAVVVLAGIGVIGALLIGVLVLVVLSSRSREWRRRG